MKPVMNLKYQTITEDMNISRKDNINILFHESLNYFKNF